MNPMQVLVSDVFKEGVIGDEGQFDITPSEKVDI